MTGTATTSPTGHCTRLTRTGQPCKRKAVAGTDPPMCPTHASSSERLTDELTDQLARLIKSGNYLETAASSCGIHVRTLMRWLALGRDPDSLPRFQRLREQVDQARADAEARNVAIIANAAREHWQAAAWLLERQYPERWARASQRDKSGAQASTSTATASDPLSEVDELAARRRHA